MCSGGREGKVEEVRELYRKGMKEMEDRVGEGWKKKEDFDGEK